MIKEIGLYVEAEPFTDEEVKMMYRYGFKDVGSDGDYGRPYTHYALIVRANEDDLDFINLMADSFDWELGWIVDMEDDYKLQDCKWIVEGKSW